MQNEAKEQVAKDGVSGRVNPLVSTVTVCDACLQASCWQGEFMCDDSRTAGTTEKTTAELTKLALEHPDYWA